MLQRLRSNQSVQSVRLIGTWTWTGPIGPRDYNRPDQSVHLLWLDRVEPIWSVRFDSVQNRSVSVRSRPRLSIPGSRVSFEALLSDKWSTYSKMTLCKCARVIGSMVATGPWKKKDETMIIPPGDCMAFKLSGNCDCWEGGVWLHLRLVTSPLLFT